ncbi:MAG TPA: DUF6766 family protein [Bryobacteraceae bacterium]|nr:DUF6766 family protein [Bryobacteraceae bacterium]
MPKLIRDNGLTVVVLLLFAGSVVGQSLTGHARYNEDQHDHDRSEIAYIEYVTSAAFAESVFENWESEFLQMAVYVWLTSFLYQRGSAQSKDPDKLEDGDKNPEDDDSGSKASNPVRDGGLLLTIYENSLALSLFVLFAAAFVLHWLGSHRHACHEQSLHGETCSTAVTHLGSSTFWFESFQNWQSEFLSIAVLVLLSIFLRQKGSPESKPMHAAHSETGK